MSEENESDMNWNSDKDLAMMISYIKEPIWNEGKDDFHVKCNLRELLQKCSGGKIVKMLKNILSPEEKSSLVRTELESFFQNQFQSFENHMRIKNEPNTCAQVKVKIEPLSEENHDEMNSETERSQSGSQALTLQVEPPSVQKPSDILQQNNSVPLMCGDKLEKQAKKSLKEKKKMKKGATKESKSMEQALLRFPHLAEQICQELGNQDLINCMKLSRTWKKFMEDEKFYWIRIIIEMTHPAFNFSRDSLEQLLKSSNRQVVKKIGVAACETIRKYKKGRFRNVFYFALVSGQTELLKKLLSRPEFLKFGNYAGSKAVEIILLSHAAKRGDLEIFQFITENAKEKNPEIWYDNLWSDGNTPMHGAAENGHLAICKLIIPNLNDKNPRNDSWRTPLDLAAENGHFDIFQLIMENVQQKNPKNRSKETPLHYAAKNGHFDICELITEKIKDKSPKDHLGNTPLHYAAQNGHFSTCELLVTKVKDINPGDKSGITPLHHAAKNGHVAICILISERVQDNNPRSDLGYTPYQLAEQNGHFKICQLFDYQLLNPKRRKIA